MLWVEQSSSLEFYSSEWVMLMLGESVLALLIVEESPGRRYYVTFYSGILSVTLFQYLFFRTQPFEADDHAFRRSGAGGLYFYYSLIFYSASLILVGCSYKMILHSYLDEEEEKEGEELGFVLEERIAQVFSWSLAVSFFTLDMMIISHRGWPENLKRLCRGGTVSVVPVVLVVINYGTYALSATLYCWLTDLEVLSFVGFVIVAFQVLLRTLALRYFPVSKRAMGRALEH